MAESELCMDARCTIRKEDLTYEPVQEKYLGAGSFGEVFIATWLGNKVAAKRLHKRVWSEGGDPSEDMKPVKRFHREYILMSLAHHPHIVHLYGVYIPDDQPDAPPVIIMELLDKTLRQLIVYGPRLLLLEVMDYSLQITSALCYLHGQTPPIIHRDLTTNNIMLTSSGVCKIVDLGLAKVFGQAARKELMSRPGNACYMPVEVLSSIGEYDERLDVFSFNIVMLEMCNGRLSLPKNDLLEKLPGGVYIPIAETERREADLSYLEDSHPLKQLIVSLLQPQEFLPPVTTVHGRLHSLRLSDEVARRSCEEAQAMRCRFAEKEEASRQEINELKETVHGVHRVMQEMWQSVSSSQQMMQEALRRMERRADNLQESVTAKVEEGNICQQRMQETLKSAEQWIGYLHESLVTTTGEVKEVSSCQQMMQNTLSSTVERVEGLHDRLFTTGAKVEEVSTTQQMMQDIFRRSERRVDSLHESVTAAAAKVEEIVTLDIDEYNEPNDTLEASQPFDETFDETFDISTGAEHLAVSGSPNDTFTLNLSICVPASIYEMSDDDLRHELLKHGEKPGPINNSTRYLYQRQLARLDKGLVNSDDLCKIAGAKTNCEFQVFPPELRQCLLGLKSLPDMSHDDDLLCDEFVSDRQPFAHSREHCIQASFVYLLIDPRVSDSLARKASFLDELDVFKQFVLSIFYVGKGKRSRPYQHLHDAMTLTKPVCQKLARIFNIWASQFGVVSLHVFQGMTQSEAYTREACIIDAMGLKHLTNTVRGHYHGTMAGKTLTFKRQFGVHLLRKACKIFLLEGERQILPKDLCP